MTKTNWFTLEDGSFDAVAEREYRYAKLSKEFEIDAEITVLPTKKHHMSKHGSRDARRAARIAIANSEELIFTLEATIQ